MQSRKEAVIIEYRTFPHIEFTIRNTMIKLGPTWSHTVICGTKNADFITNICESIHPHIRVIVTGVENIAPSTYSRLLSTEQFWNMLHGDKILIYQEDSIMFKTNIAEFLEWDYIGAPWPAGQDDAPILVGNGGFSLRTRKVMLDVIATTPINKMSPTSSTIRYMNATQSTTIPEDVYFTNIIQQYKLGRVAPVNIATQFSTESVYSPTSLGGHCFWIKDPEWKKRLYANNIVQFKCLTALKTTHRGGFASILQTMQDHEFIDINGTYDFLPVVEEAYIWNNNSLRPTQPWIGMVHLTPNVPAYLNMVDLNKLIKNPLFKKDITTCKLLITFSHYLTKYLKMLLPSLKIVTMYHPVVSENIPEFTMQKYAANKDKHIIQIGQQLRRITSLYKINPAGFKKIWLTGEPDMASSTRKLMLECKATRYSIKDPEELMYYTKTFEEYDSFLEKNIVFIDLIDSAANNTVLECIVRNTPIIVNRTAGVVEYLGEGYPLYFDSLTEVTRLVSYENIKRAHMYLKKIDKSRFTMETFVKNFAAAALSI